MKKALLFILTLALWVVAIIATVWMGGAVDAAMQPFDGYLGPLLDAMAGEDARAALIAMAAVCFAVAALAAMGAAVVGRRLLTAN